MLLKSLDDILAGTDPGIGQRWVSAVKDSKTQIKVFCRLGDEELLSVFGETLRKLGRWLDRSADKNEIGAFFVMVAQEYCAQGVPLSELTFSLMLARKLISDHVAGGAELDGAFQIYALMEAVNMTADFFFLGMHYTTKGYLEKTFQRFEKGEDVSVEVLRKYFPDDFFFKRPD